MKLSFECISVADKSNFLYHFASSKINAPESRRNENLIESFRFERLRPLGLFYAPLSVRCICTRLYTLARVCAIFCGIPTIVLFLVKEKHYCSWHNIINQILGLIAV